MNFICLAKYNAGWIGPALQKLADEHSYTNVFNPSIVCVDGIWHLAFRAQSKVGEKPFRAFYTTGTEGSFSTPTDLSTALAGLGIPQVADPKLVQLYGQVYLTFNSGYSANQENTLCLLHVGAEIGVPQKCELDGRQLVEKNWAFYTDESGVLCAIYSLEPFAQLRHIGGSLGSSDPLKFARVDTAQNGTAISQNLSIGSQLTFLNENVAYMVAHEKPRLGSKRGYLGRLVKITFDSNGRIAYAVGRKRLIHSLQKLFLLGRRHNPNLLWAVYFAGIASEGDDLVLSYGINDLEFSFARIPLGTIWP